MKASQLIQLLLVATIGVAAPVVARDLTCGFKARGLTMSFPPLDPSSGTNATAVLTAATDANLAGDCDKPLTMVISADGGQNFNGSPRLSNGTEYIPYSLAGLPINTSGPGNAKYIAFTITGSILWSAYANASVGNYSDTVMISVTP